MCEENEDNYFNENDNMKIKQEDKTEKRGCYKAFGELKTQMMLKRSNPLIKLIEEWCYNNNCSFLEALGYCIHRKLYMTNKRIADVGWQLFKEGENALVVSKVPVKVALWMAEQMALGRGRYTDIRLQMLRYIS